MVLFVAMAVTGLSGRDLVGRTAYLYVRGYGLFIWTMLLLFLTRDRAREERAPAKTPRDSSAIALQALVTALPPGLNTKLGLILFAGGVTAGLLVDAVSEPWVQRYPAPGSR